MNRFATFLLLFITCVVLSAKSPQSVITFENTVVKLGTFPESRPIVSSEFVFKNTGDAPLVIHQAIASCGCTTAMFTEKPIQPGESGKVSVTYNGTGRYPGFFKKIITIRSNAKNGLVRLYIEGNMQASSSNNDKKRVIQDICRVLCGTIPMW